MSLIQLNSVEADTTSGSSIPNAELPDPFTEIHRSSETGNQFARDYETVNSTRPFSYGLPSPPYSIQSIEGDLSTPPSRPSPEIGFYPLFGSPTEASEGLTLDIPVAPELDIFKYPSKSCLSANPPTETSGQSTFNTTAATGLCPLKSKSRTPGPSPDRFIPTRRSPTSATRSFRMGKPVNRLTSSEKLLRRRSGSPDVFGPTPVSRDTTRGSTLTNTFRARQRGRTGLARSTSVLGIRRDSGNAARRQASIGAVWNVGGTAAATIGPISGIQDGRGGLLGSGTNAPMYTSRFLEGDTPDQDLEKHEGRLALAFDFDQANKVLEFASLSGGDASGPARFRGRLGSFPTNTRGHGVAHEAQTVWRDNKWIKDGATTLLDAPELRDDYYCNLLAYSHSTHSLAVGLNRRVYIWSELHGVQPLGQWTNSMAYLTSLSFSSPEGGQSILAIGRIDGQITLWSLYDIEPRFEAQQPAPIACLIWKPRTTQRKTQRNSENMTQVTTEELLVGDEVGNVYYYSVEWPMEFRLGLDNWPGSMTLLARITVHTQQICGLVWSPDGDYFATGGNDNTCCLFEAKALLRQRDMEGDQGGVITDEPVIGINGVRSGFRVQPGIGSTRFIPMGREKHKWVHGAAVKAIAFCPWQRGLIATGGGSNDRCIHFYHTFSGACLATISVAAQVTSLIWSTTRREIAATFGYASPDHPYRIAVFSWPECRQIVAIPWASEMRALYAIAYPGGPNETNTQRAGAGASRTAEEGCIVIASSDESVKFHEVWSEAKGTVSVNKGMLGGSDILESLEGIDKEGEETIR